MLAELFAVMVASVSGQMDELMGCLSLVTPFKSLEELSAVRIRLPWTILRRPHHVGGGLAGSNLPSILLWLRSGRCHHRLGF